MPKHTRFTEGGEDAAAEPKASAATLGPKPTITRKRGRPSGGGGGGGGGGAAAGARSAKPLAGRIRSLDRLIKHRAATLPPTALAKMREELHALQRLQAEHGRRGQERRFAKKYHMVRFFERAKLERQLRAVERGASEAPAGKDGQGQGDGEGAKKREQERAQIKRDLLYVQRFPKDRKYVALFPKGGHDARSQRLVNEIRAEIEAAATGLQAAQAALPAAPADPPVEAPVVAPAAVDPADDNARSRRRRGRAKEKAEQLRLKEGGKSAVPRDDFFVDVEEDEPAAPVVAKSSSDAGDADEESSSEEDDDESDE